jgi:hypothetical protein
VKRRGRTDEQKLRDHIKHYVNNRVARGDIAKPDTCRSCGDKVLRLEGHHYLGYEESHWLDVQWLCHTCHRKVHGTYRE